MSSVMPSAKYSCSGSPLMLANGKTAVEGLSGSEGIPLFADALEPVVGAVVTSDEGFQSAVSHLTWNACTGRSIFLSARLPRSVNVAFNRPVTASWTA